MSIVKDPVVGLIRRDAGGQDDPVLEALRRGEDIADRRANLLRLAWDQTMPYEEAERLLPDDEMDDLCDLLDDVRMYGIVHCVYQLLAAQRNGWILTDEDRAWYRGECGLPPEREWTASDEVRRSLWRKGIRIADEVEHLARWVLDTRIDHAELTARVPTEELWRVFKIVDPETVRRNAAALAEAKRAGWLTPDEAWDVSDHTLDAWSTRSATHELRDARCGASSHSGATRFAPHATPLRTIRFHVASRSFRLPTRTSSAFVRPIIFE